MIFRILLYSGLIIFLAGLVYRFRSIARKSRFFEKGKKFRPKTGFDLNIRGGLLNTLFQIKLFKAGKQRWLVHFMVISGFAYLLVVHALDDMITILFPEYQPGIAPFRFLRNLAGASVGLGCIFFLIRHLNPFRPYWSTINESRINGEGVNQNKESRFQGIGSILLILGLVGSGFLLESFRIMSEPRFDEMVEEYSHLDEENGLMDLRDFWVQEYHLVVKNTTLKARKFEAGSDLNQEYCIDCHDRPDSAFVSTTLAGIARGLGNRLARFRVDNFLYWLHYGIALVLLALLPFSRMFHLISIPVASTRKRVTPQSLEQEGRSLDLFSLTACTNCGFCSQVCNVYPNFQITGNTGILPHVKIEAIRTILKKGIGDAGTAVNLRSGNDDCTRCGRCGDICPSGIDLVRLWESADLLMEDLGCPDNYTQVFETSLDQWTGQSPLLQKPGTTSSFNGLTDRVEAFENCVQCTICTNACPVVAYDPDQTDLGPHQVMNLLRLGKKEMATASPMVWNCLTCYACQELCPQAIRITDILLELRAQGQNRAEQIKLSQLTFQGADK